MNDLLECTLVIVGYVGVSCNVQVIVRWMALGVNINSTEEGTACGSSSEDESNCIGYLLAPTKVLATITFDGPCDP